MALHAYTTAPLAEPPPDLMTIKQRPYIPTAENLEYAIVQYGGRQHMVTEGSMYETHFIRAVPGSTVRLNRVLLLKQRDDAGEFQVTIGQPIVDGAYCEITVLEHLKSDEQIIYRHRPKKHYQRRFHVFQKLTRFRLDKIVWEKDVDWRTAEIPGRKPFPLAWDEETQIGAPPGTEITPDPRKKFRKLNMDELEPWRGGGRR